MERCVSGVLERGVEGEKLGEKLWLRDSDGAVTVVGQVESQEAGGVMV